MTTRITQAILVLFAMFALAGQAFAQDILVVDMQKVYADSKVGKHIQGRMKSFASTDEATLKSRASSLEATAKSLESQTKGLDANALKANTSLVTQIQDFYKRQGELAQETQKKAAELQLTQAKARAEVNKRLKTIFDQIAREKSASAIMEKGAVLYVPNTSGADITSLVIQRLDSQMTTVAVSRQALPQR